MKRRSFLKAVAAGGLLAGAGFPANAYARRKPTITVITDITPATPVSRLAAMLGGMLTKGLPVTCIVQTKAPDGSMLRPDSKLAGLLRDFMTQSPGLVEIVAYVESLAVQTPHFQSRSAYQARKELIEALVPEGDLRDTGPLMQSIACNHAAEPLSPESVRSAGIRNILVLPEGSASVATETWSNDVLRVFGGIRGDLFAAVESLGQLSPEQFQNVILLSIQENSTKSEHLIAAAAKVFANVALQHEADQWISNLRLCDLQLRDGYFSFTRRVGLHLYAPDYADTDLLPGFQAFQAELLARGVPFSVGPSPLQTNEETSRQGYWIETEDPAKAKAVAGGSRPEILVGLNCALPPTVLDTAQSPFVDAGVGLILDPRAGGIQGIDDCGRLHIPVLPISQIDSTQPRMLSSATNTRDLVITISPKILATRALRSALLTELENLTKDWVTGIVPIADLVRPIVPHGHIISLYRHTEAYAPKIRIASKASNPDQRQLLLENAVAAWNYFYRFTNKRTGLCPATVLYVYGEKSEHKAATMWDMGSHINALMAAVDLEIITDAEFRKSIGKILSSIAGRTSQDRTLPSEWIRTDRVRRGNRNFDGCDAGRLLAALWNLSRHRLGNAKPEELVKSWDLEKIIIDGKVHSVKEGELVSTYQSHCAHYTALAFRAWGFDVASPYEVFGTQSACDARIKLLEASAKIGPIGAEPLLLEAMDFGLSRESAYLADVLYGAQLREYEKTGNLICVSEGPIDRSPWFTYQGLQIDAPDRTWVIDTVRDDPAYKLEDFQNEFRAISPKAAFLWAAQVPNAFSDTLLDYVRTNGKTTIGFASNIYSKTGKPTSNYSDINTNGIILQAIAHMLRDPSVGI